MSLSKFRSIKKEAAFFKHIKPDFISRLLYFRKLFMVQLFEIAHADDARLAFFREQLQSIQSFLFRHQELYPYVLSKADENDQFTFPRYGDGP
jgi:hypothetical protein